MKSLKSGGLLSEVGSDEDVSGATLINTWIIGGGLFAPNH